MTTVVNKREVEPQTGDVYIGRGSVWGNPYTHLPVWTTKAEHQVATRQEAIERYREYILRRPDLLARLPELVGRRLVCFCKPAACHGDILIALLRERGLEP